MNRVLERGSRHLVWGFAFIMAISAARYLYLSRQTVERFEDQTNAVLSRVLHFSPIPPLHPFSHHPVLLSVHVLACVVTMIAGLFQFLPALRDMRPQVHRKVGYVYTSAVMVGSAVGLPLSFVFFSPLPAELRRQLLPTTIAFAVLSVTWPLVTLMALSHARGRSFQQHRAWMIRSYCLTYSAVTTRLFVPIFLLLTRDPLLSVNLSIGTWPLNVLFAEWLIRREGSQAVVRTRAVAAGH